MPNTADYLNQLLDDKHDLVTILNNKGVTALDTETFTELVPKVDTISGGGNIGYQVTFKVEGNDYYIASCQQGESVEQPPEPTLASGEYLVSWQLNGIDVSFPYTPSADTELTANIETYTLLSYIESTGTQYIDTGVPARAWQKIEVDIQQTDNTQKDQTVIGGSDKAFTNCVYLGFNWNSAYLGYYVGVVNWLDIRNVADLNRNTITVSAQTSDIEVTKNGNSIFTYTSYTFPVASSSTTLYAFGRYGGTNLLWAKLYSLKIYDWLDNGNLVRDYIPVLNSNNEAGLFDLVNKRFYGNDGSGTFLYG